MRNRRDLEQVGADRRFAPERAAAFDWNDWRGWTEIDGQAATKRAPVPATVRVR